MQKRALILAVSALWLLTASCGKPFAIVGGGGGGAGGSGAGTTTSSSATGSTTTAGMAGDACTPTTKGVCAAGLYCKTKDCKTGTCEEIPAPQGQQWSPVCGCDRILYWNAELAIASDVSFELTADCNQSQLTQCTPTSNPCSNEDGVYCNLHAGGIDVACSPPTGFCTKVPDTCDGTTLTGKECFQATGGCRYACELMKEQKIWYTPSPECAL